METEFKRYICRDCGGVAHPASGCSYTPTYIVCGPCIRQVFKQLEIITNSKGRRGNKSGFYAHVNVIAPPMSV